MAARVGLLAGDLTDVDFFRGVRAGDDDEDEGGEEDRLERRLEERLTTIVGMRYVEGSVERGFID